ncbi:hypothetical protein OTU49_010913, partial [Cherax quadricarinatus]
TFSSLSQFWNIFFRGCRSGMQQPSTRCWCVQVFSTVLEGELLQSSVSCSRSGTSQPPHPSPGATVLLPPTEAALPGPKRGVEHLQGWIAGGGPVDSWGVWCRF